MEPHPPVDFPDCPTTAGKATGGRGSVSGSPSPLIFRAQYSQGQNFKVRERESLGTRLGRITALIMRTCTYTYVCKDLEGKSVSCRIKVC